MPYWIIDKFRNPTNCEQSTDCDNRSPGECLNKSYTITAEVTIPEDGAEGMIVTQGGRFGGYGHNRAQKTVWVEVML